MVLLASEVYWTTCAIGLYSQHQRSTVLLVPLVCTPNIRGISQCPCYSSWPRGMSCSFVTLLLLLIQRLIMLLLLLLLLTQRHVTFLSICRYSSPRDMSCSQVNQLRLLDTEACHVPLWHCYNLLTNRPVFVHHIPVPVRGHVRRPGTRHHHVPLRAVHGRYGKETRIPGI